MRARVLPPDDKNQSSSHSTFVTQYLAYKPSEVVGIVSRFKRALNYKIDLNWSINCYHSLSLINPIDIAYLITPLELSGIIDTTWSIHFFASDFFAIMLYFS